MIHDHHTRINPVQPVGRTAQWALSTDYHTKNIFGSFEGMKERLQHEWSTYSNPLLGAILV